MIRRYQLVSSMISAGVLAASSIHREQTIQSRDAATVNTQPAMSAVEYCTLNIFISCAPYHCASKMPTPMDRPTRKNKTTDMIGLATLTAANALFPIILPTIIASAVL